RQIDPELTRGTCERTRDGRDLDMRVEFRQRTGIEAQPRRCVGDDMMQLDPPESLLGEARMDGGEGGGVVDPHLDRQAFAQSLARTAARQVEADLILVVIPDLGLPRQLAAELED